MSQLTFEKMSRCCIRGQKNMAALFLPLHLFLRLFFPATLSLVGPEILLVKQHFKRRNVSDHLGPLSLQKLALSLNVILVGKWTTFGSTFPPLQ